MILLIQLRFQRLDSLFLLENIERQLLNLLQKSYLLFAGLFSYFHSHGIIHPAITEDEE